MKSALLVIDAQRVYTDKGSEFFCKDSVRTVDRINSLVEAFVEANKPVFMIRHIHKRDGSDLGRMFDFAGEPVEDFNFKDGDAEVDYNERLVRPPSAIEMTKNRYSAFAGTPLEANLRRQQIDRLVICGFMTNFCCDSTARYAHDADFYVDFIPDATGAPATEQFSEHELRKAVADTMEAGIARVFSTKQFLKQWDRA